MSTWLYQFWFYSFKQQALGPRPSKLDRRSAWVRQFQRRVCTEHAWYAVSYQNSPSDVAMTSPSAEYSIALVSLEHSQRNIRYEPAPSLPGHKRIAEISVTLKAGDSGRRPG